MYKFIFFNFFLGIVSLCAQNNTTYWQQHVSYTMDIDMEVKKNQYTGTQELIYTNNSPDTLTKAFYHLYFNAFQPESEMAVHSQHIPDPDPRVGNRINQLTPEEIGYLRVSSLTQDGIAVAYKTSGTILKVTLAKPILPGEKTIFTMVFKGQVPVQIRRSGRDNAEGVALSMTQWYPKMAEYDFEGWHADPYIAREFHGVWGDFDVTIHIDKKYTLGGSGYLQNPQEIGHGYELPNTKVKPKGKKLSWHFKAPNVHDFSWAADPDYIHDMVQVPNGPLLHFLYKDKKELREHWKNLQQKSVALMNYYTERIGPYPYKQYSIIQGGDGGMEYAMCTLITGERSFQSLVGVTAHEMAHAWFQHILATNEAKHAWMDEGFTTYISTLAMHDIMSKEKINLNPLKDSYRTYIELAKSGVEQPQCTHADRYHYNMAYSISAYSKGALFLAELGYIIGQEKLNTALKKYYDVWKFKHPTPNDFKRIAEDVSGMQLDWFLTDWTQTTNTIDYAITKVKSDTSNTTTLVTLERVGLMPMPIDLYVTYTDGTQASFYIPLRMMHGTKDNPIPSIKRTVVADWPWAYPTYTLNIDSPKSEIKAIHIDITNRLADIDDSNNSYKASTDSK